jgi:hypothetical protein
MKARKCFMCRLLAKAYEMAKRRGEKCALCAFIAFLLAVPVGACASDTETEGCVSAMSAVIPERIVIQLPNMPPCWLFKKLTGKDPPTPRAFAIAFVNSAAHATGTSLRFE